MHLNWTKYKGYKPEVDYNNGNNLTPGVDYGKYPLSRNYMSECKLLSKITII
jgi:hypothetical protein